MSEDRFDHVFIQTLLFERSYFFYHETLGWNLINSWGDDASPRGAILSSGSMTIVIAEPHNAYDNSNKDSSRNHKFATHLMVEDIDKRYSELHPSGITLFPPENTHWGTRWFLVRDPDGYLIAFEQYT